MKIKSVIAVNLVLASILLASILLVATTTSQGEYDPWKDLNDDGWIEIMDFYLLATGFGTQGTPINKTALILELQSRISELEARTPATGNISISAAAFMAQDAQVYYADYAWLCASAGIFWAPLQLPHGANITQMTAFVFDGLDSQFVAVELRGFNLTNDSRLSVPMTRVETSIAGTSPDVQILSTNTINDSIVDNNNCIYGLRLILSTSSVDLGIRGVIIEYEYPA